ncbi:hypothetical protein PG994_006310 [Apiospora phragmitis]|uniref:Uncharacterized protein n=1 Tax=Apiospora phragmitis TaxID=2905665 RepID=A0ABR1VI94_9PEZI
MKGGTSQRFQDSGDNGYKRLRLKMIARFAAIRLLMVEMEERDRRNKDQVNTHDLEQDPGRGPRAIAESYIESVL